MTSHCVEHQESFKGVEEKLHALSLNIAVLQKETGIRSENKECRLARIEVKIDEIVSKFDKLDSLITFKVFKVVSAFTDSIGFLTGVIFWIISH